jgi:hypothetical protein
MKMKNFDLIVETFSVKVNRINISIQIKF